MSFVHCRRHLNLTVTVCQIYSQCRPFSDVNNEVVVVQKVLGGQRPLRPCGRREMSDDLWNVVEDCWKQDFRERPTIEEVVQVMKQGNFNLS